MSLTLKAVVRFVLCSLFEYGVRLHVHTFHRCIFSKTFGRRALGYYADSL